MSAKKSEMKEEPDRAVGGGTTASSSSAEEEPPPVPAVPPPPVLCPLVLQKKTDTEELLGTLEEAHVEAELLRQVETLEAKNGVLALDLDRLDAGMACGIAEREIKIKQLSDVADNLVGENAALQQKLRAEEDRLEAGLVASRCIIDNRVSALAHEVISQRGELQSAADLATRELEMTRELAELRESTERRDAEFEAQVAEMENDKSVSEARWQAEMDARYEEARKALRTKFENDVFTKYHTIESEHARMKAELGYQVPHISMFAILLLPQAHRIELLLAANESLKQRKRMLATSIKREYESQFSMAQCSRYHARQRGSDQTHVAGDGLSTLNALSEATGGGQFMPQILNTHL